MAHAFDSRALARLSDELGTLFARARDQEDGLSQLTNAVDDGALRAAARTLCVSAREQRERLQGLLRSLVGSPPPSESPRPLVLIVNDAGDDRELTASVLESAGVDVITATNGLEAVLAASYARPSLVLMDVNMPLLDGIEAARLMKAYPATQQLTLVAHTAWPQYYNGPLKRLFDAVIAKPTPPDDLIAAVHRFLSGGSSAAAATAGRGV